MKTYMAATDSVKKYWYLVDASGKTLGRLASELAYRLRGKHKVEFTPHTDTGDFFVVVNIEKIKVTGKKMTDKKYYWHTGYPGGIKSINFQDLLTKHPERVLEKAVKGMLPRGPLGRKMLKKLKVYAGEQHPHEAQKPRVIQLNEDK
jgi:large subunit ribosomal protein L13